MKLSPQKDYANNAEAATNASNRTVGLYNGICPHSTLDYQPPSADEHNQMGNLSRYLTVLNHHTHPE